MRPFSRLNYIPRLTIFPPESRLVRRVKWTAFQKVDIFLLSFSFEVVFIKFVKFTPLKVWRGSCFNKDNCLRITWWKLHFSSNEEILKTWDCLTNVSLSSWSQSLSSDWWIFQVNSVGSFDWLSDCRWPSCRVTQYTFVGYYHKFRLVLL